MSKPPQKILVIPDTQIRPGVPINHLDCLGRYIAEKRPDVVVHLGDHWDMPSLSSYDKGKAAAEGRRVMKDIQAGNLALARLTSGFVRKNYNPRRIILRGNHEERLDRYLNDHAELTGTFDGAFNDERLGWEVVPVPAFVDAGRCGCGGVG